MMKKGLIYVFGAYAIWGFFPIYFKLLQAVPAIQIVAHRISWSFIILLILVSLKGQLRNIRVLISPRIILLYLAAGILLSVNWLTYVWGVNSGFVIETSLGYFINPLVSVLLGVVILREKLRPLQWLPVGLASAGVIYLTVQHGSLPWIALALAFSFGIYGLLKKIAPLKSLPGLTIETAGVFIPALGFLIFSEIQQTGAFGHVDVKTTFLLILAGLVTAIPLIFFASGAPLVPLSTIGILQYIAPTLQFLIGVFVFHEPFSYHQMIGFAIIWLALIIFSIEGLNARKQALKIANLAQI
jgi:chloramphenicol-sensitive protein RarD